MDLPKLVYSACWCDAISPELLLDSKLCLVNINAPLPLFLHTVIPNKSLDHTAHGRHQPNALLYCSCFDISNVVYFSAQMYKDIAAAAGSNGLRSRVLKETIANFNLSKKPICHAEKRIDENVFRTLFILLVVAQGAPMGYFDHSISEKIFMHTKHCHSQIHKYEVVSHMLNAHTKMLTLN